MVIIGLFVVLLCVVAAIVPALARTWPGWFRLAAIAALPMAITAILGLRAGSSRDAEIFWMFSAYLGIGWTIGCAAGLYGLIGRKRGWPFSGLHHPAIIAFAVAIGFFVIRPGVIG